MPRVTAKRRCKSKPYDNHDYWEEHVDTAPRVNRKCCRCKKKVPVRIISYKHGQVVYGNILYVSNITKGRIYCAACWDKNTTIRSLFRRASRGFNPHRRNRVHRERQWTLVDENANVWRNELHNMVLSLAPEDDGNDESHGTQPQATPTARSNMVGTLQNNINDEYQDPIVSHMQQVLHQYQNQNGERQQ